MTHNSLSSQLSLIIPAYNEEQRLPGFLSSIAKWHNTNPNTIFEIIIVDDGSTDQTSSIARSFADRLPIQLIKLDPNQGKGAAVQRGVIKAKAEYIVFMDADGATDISELPKMITALSKSDIAIGNRWLPGAKTERHSFLRKLSGWTYRRYMTLFGLGAIDTMCGFKGYRKHVAQKLFSNLQEKRWLFDTEVAYKAVKSNHSITNFPITWESKDGSKLDTKTLVKSALQIWPLIQKIKKDRT